MYKACKHIIEFFCLCFSVFCSSHSISKSSVEVNLSTWMISSVSSSPSQLVLQEGSLRLVYKLNELAVEAISRIGSPLWFNSFLFLAASISCRSNSCFLRSLTPSSLAFSASASLSLGVFDCFFPRLRVGTQSKLKAPHILQLFRKQSDDRRLARCRGLSLFLCRLDWWPQSSVFFLFLVRSSCSCPWFVTILGMEWKLTLCFPPL